MIIQALIPRRRSELLKSALASTTLSTSDLCKENILDFSHLASPMSRCQSSGRGISVATVLGAQSAAAETDYVGGRISSILFSHTEAGSFYPILLLAMTVTVLMTSGRNTKGFVQRRNVYLAICATRVSCQGGMSCTGSRNKKKTIDDKVHADEIKKKGPLSTRPCLLYKKVAESFIGHYFHSVWGGCAD